MLSPEVANDKSLYPDAATIQKGEWQNDVGSASTLYEEYYQKLESGSLISPYCRASARQYALSGRPLLAHE
ncbi:ABC transporter [Klebsiella grimontii]|uniref:ABC transporter n=1 Tax=Klebsiella grimontii TaxID=2058152 RepID=A0A7H4P619_9ENTR|nr:ABC transporter [Klebsiella grimontii]